MAKIPDSPGGSALPTRDSAARSPLLWLLVPACAGIYAASAAPPGKPVAACLAGLLLSLAATALLSRRTRAALRRAPLRRGTLEALWGAAFVAGAFLVFWSYGSARMLDKLENRAALPSREATLEMRVTDVYAPDKFGNQRGLAVIVQAPPIQHYLVRQKVIYRIKGDLTAREGATLRVTGLIQRKPLDAAPGTFDSWLEHSEIYFELRRGHILAETAPPSTFTRTTLATRRWMRERLLEGSDKLEGIRAMVPAMLLGEKNLLTPEDKALFKVTGMMHLFAVSGLHVGLVALTLETLLAACRVPRVPRILTAQAALFGYVCVIGAPPSAVRAFIMILFHRAAALDGRPSRGLPALAASALAVIVWDPRQLFDVGAQLSYGIVASIMLYGMPLAELLKERLAPYKDLPPVDRRLWQNGMLTSRDWLCDAFATTLGAFFVSVPISMQYFGNFAPGSILLNLLMIPLALLSAVASVITILFAGAALLPGLGFLAHAGIFFNYADWMCAWEMEGIIDGVNRIPHLFYKAGFAASWIGGTATVAVLALMLLLRDRKLSGSLLWMLSPALLLAEVVGLAFL